ncbi:MAG: hypothetical protein KGO22_12770 [Gammaproteobacteria bacterium]|nr:hypothetical protein [Gammaproteobacteria bacterium]
MTLPGARSQRAARTRLVALALLAFALRALIPIGFMPAGDGTFSLLICPGGLPPALLPGQKMLHDDMGMPMPQPEHHHGHGVMDDGYCIFTTGFSPAPPPLLLAALALLVAILGVGSSRVSAPAGIRLVHVPQARAPPACA